VSNKKEIFSDLTFSAKCQGSSHEMFTQDAIEQPSLHKIISLTLANEWWMSKYSKYLADKEYFILPHHNCKMINQKAMNFIKEQSSDVSNAK
jgi:hypothetical protein